MDKFELSPYTRDERRRKGVCSIFSLTKILMLKSPSSSHDEVIIVEFRDPIKSRSEIARMINRKIPHNTLTKITAMKSRKMRRDMLDKNTIRVQIDSSIIANKGAIKFYYGAASLFSRPITCAYYFSAICEYNLKYILHINNKMYNEKYALCKLYYFIIHVMRIMQYGSII